MTDDSNYEEGQRVRPEPDTLGNFISRLVDEARLESWHLGYEAAAADYRANPELATRKYTKIDDLLEDRGL